MVGNNRLRFYQDLHFEYDLHGNVVRRTRGNQKAGHHEVAELRWMHSQRGGKASLFIYEPGSFVPLATVQGTQQPGDRRIYWYQCDQIGAPLELTDAQGHIAWAADYKV